MKGVGPERLLKVIDDLGNVLIKKDLPVGGVGWRQSRGQGSFNQNLWIAGVFIEQREKSLLKEQAFLCLDFPSIRR